MNILHHKSWHVRTKKNIEKVRNDEQQALKEQIEKARRSDIAEQERRIGQLRKLNNKNVDDLNQESKQSINLFNLDQDCSKNKAHELEKKKQQQEWEKKQNILVYLGGSQVNSDIPWYEKSSIEPDKLTYKKTKKIDLNDPLNQIKNKLNKNKNQEKSTNLNDMKKKIDFKKESITFQLNLNNQAQDFDEKTLKLIKLRTQRLKREQKEKLKSRDLLNKKVLSNYNLDERNQTYNNQFNPNISKN